MNSLIRLRWYQGGRKVSSATIQRGGKITKSQFAVPGVSLGEVSTVKIDGSGWSKLIEPMVMKWRVSYLQRRQVAVPGDHVEGRVRCVARHSAPPNLLDHLVRAPASSSKAATGARKSRALARPLEPIGPSSGRRNGAP